jgi:antitoxin VapB
MRLGSGEVYVKRLGRSLLLIPKDADLWDLMAESLGQFTDDFMADRAQPTPQQREAMFE